MYGGSGYIGAFDNTGNWEITLQAKWSNTQCGVWIIKSDETSRDNNDILILRDNFYYHVNGSGTSGGGNMLKSSNTYYPITLTKNGNSLTISVNNITRTFNWSLATSLSTLSIGVDSWGGTATIKDIIVKPL
jgi:hypothetical protein